MPRTPSIRITIITRVMTVVALGTVLTLPAFAQRVTVESALGNRAGQSNVTTNGPTFSGAGVIGGAGATGTYVVPRATPRPPGNTGATPGTFSSRTSTLPRTGNGSLEAGGAGRSPRTLGQDRSTIGPIDGDGSTRRARVGAAGAAGSSPLGQDSTSRVTRGGNTGVRTSNSPGGSGGGSLGQDTRN